MMKKNKVQNQFERLSSLYPAAHCALIFRNPFELLIATILSAQCTDKRVNMVTPQLFKLYPRPIDLAQANPEEVMQIIRSTGFFRNKTKNIIGCAQKLVENFNEQIPEHMEQLITLPGVARKTANVVLWNCFGKNEGVVVDTHVGRIAQRLGWTKSKNPAMIEKDLMKQFDRKQWGQVSHLLIDFGRDICTARNPNCTNCQFKSDCLWFKKNK